MSMAFVPWWANFSFSSVFCRYIDLTFLSTIAQFGSYLSTISCEWNGIDMWSILMQNLRFGMSIAANATADSAVAYFQSDSVLDMNRSP